MIILFQQSSSIRSSLTVHSIGSCIIDGRLQISSKQLIKTKGVSQLNNYM
jgi:hypothetical protein